MEDVRGFHYTVSDEQLAQYETWTIEDRMRWLHGAAYFTLSLQTREERIRAYRLKAGENVAYYDAQGWPENF